ncbi:MAG: 50S ribosomal protein L25 [Deltaproteobacteria bacterium]|jgi:large subunit ribosomal protein L25|nr:50S ribosomal protein L25 [Deltaproteobacteria bacterium]
MGLSTTLTAKLRKPGSSNEARRIRREGNLPAVFYGEKSEPKSLYLSYKEVRNAFLNDPGNRSLFTLSIDGEGTYPILVREYQISPVTRRLLHVDFLRIDPDKKVTVRVPLTLKGKALGVEKGGQLQQSEREIPVKGLPADIPSVIEADVTSLSLGQTMHMSQVLLPETLTLVKTVDLPVALVSVPKGLKTEESAEASAAASPAAAPAKAAKADKKK